MAENPITIRCLALCEAAVYGDFRDSDDAIAAAARCYPYAAGRYCTASTGIEATQRRTAAASRARVRAAFFLRNPSQQPAAADLGKGQYPDAGWNPSVSWELLENGEKQEEWSLAPAGEDKVPTM